LNRINVLALAAFAPAVGFGQSGAIPGRDLLAYPIGLVSEAAALPGILGAGLFNPATATLGAADGWRLAAAAMASPSDIGASANSFALGRAWRGTTFTVSVLRAAVGGLVRTDADPLTVGNDVTYATSVASLGASRRFSHHLVYGVALRGRSGQLDIDRGSGLGVDAGVVADHLTRFDARLGASTFLLTPFRRNEEPPTIVLGADARVAGSDSLRSVRAGLSFATTSGRTSEQFAFVGARYHAWELRGGAARTDAYGATNMRGRMAVAVHYGPYIVGVAREGSPGGLGASYQFVLSSLVR
jgi:hypothetical protein